MNAVINQIFGNAARSIEAKANLAAEILDELGMVAVSMRSFNDDDWYTYNTETLELKEGRGAHYERPTQPKAPLKTVRGMTAKHLSLWVYKQGVAA